MDFIIYFILINSITFLFEAKQTITITTTKTTITTTSKIKLSVECLVVIDSSVYQIFQNLYDFNSSTSVINNNINIFFSQVLNQV